MSMARIRDEIWGYTLLRLALGMSMLIHGVARIPKVSAFVTATTKMFADTPLPNFAVAAFARVTPFVELLIGVSLVVGLFTRSGLISGGIWMVLLIFGSTLIEKYDIVGIQLIYSLIFFQLLIHIRLNDLSVDRLIAGSAKNS
jgi:thiosulfate dehydrogenase [quinone] large subunit